MTVIEIETCIASDIYRCFDLTRDIELHKLSTATTRETVVGGRTTGVCELGDNITWEAKHFGIRQQLSVEITGLNKPYFFEDKMTKGAFKSMRHQHYFREVRGSTIMTDRFEYEVPFGRFGEFFDKIILKRYMTTFLKKRNNVIKQIAEKK